MTLLACHCWSFVRGVKRAAAPEPPNCDSDHDPEHEALHMTDPMREVLNPMVFPVDGKRHKVSDEGRADLRSSLDPNACVALQCSRRICINTPLHSAPSP